MFLPYLSNSCYESDYECLCIVIIGKIRSVPLNILSSVQKTIQGTHIYIPLYYILYLRPKYISSK